jgi:hypothetical protein
VSLRRAQAREQVQWVRSGSPQANEMVQWTISNDERPKGSAGLGASLASLEEGQAFLGSLTLRQEKLSQRRELGRAAAANAQNSSRL